MPKTLEEKRHYLRRWHEKNPHKSKLYQAMWEAKNPEKVKKCGRERSARWRLKNPEKHKEVYRRANKRRATKLKDWYLNDKYGISREEWDKLFLSQGSRCAVCKTTEPRGVGWCTDHCHQRLQIRGIICHFCNSALGYAKDDPQILRALTDYLEKFNGTH